MFCEKCGNKTDEDATYCPHCGSPMKKTSAIQNEDIKNISYKIKITGLLIVLIGIIGVVDTISFRLVWNQEWAQLIYGSWYQFVYIILYSLGIAYGIELTKREGWVICFTLVLIYVVHFSVIFIEKGIKSPVIISYVIPILSLIALILLIITKGEFETNKGEKEKVK